MLVVIMLQAALAMGMSVRMIVAVVVVMVVAVIVTMVMMIVVMPAAGDLRKEQPGADKRDQRIARDLDPLRRGPPRGLDPLPRRHGARVRRVRRTVRADAVAPAT